MRDEANKLAWTTKNVKASAMEHRKEHQITDDPQDPQTLFYPKLL